MNSFINGSKLILSNGKKYWFAFLVVISLMIGATYLNVQAPKLLGESVEDLSTYVYLATIEQTQEELDNIIATDGEIDTAFKDKIAKYFALDEESKQKLLNASSEEIKSQAKFNNTLTSIILMDKNYILAHGAFSPEQIAKINDSDLTIEEKYLMLNLPPDTLTSLADSTYDLKEKTSEKKEAFYSAVKKLMLVFVFLGVGMFTYTMIFVGVTVNTTRRIRNRLFEKIQQLSIRFYDMSNTGDLLSRFTNDIENITMFLNSAFIQVLSALCMLGGVCIMMYREDTSSIEIANFTIDKPLFWIILVFGLIALILSLTIVKKAQRYVGQQQKKLGVLNGFVDETLSGQKEVITYNLSEQMIDKFKELNQDFKTNAFKGQIYSGLLMPIMMGTGFITIGLIVFLGSDMVIEGIFAVALLVTFMQYTQQFFQNMSSTVSQYNTIELGLSGANRVYEVMEEKSEITNKNDSISLTNPKSDIVFDNVDFEYLEGKPVLKKVSFASKPGEMVAIVGPTGSGKTTIMNLLNRFYDVSGGKITIDGTDIRDYTLEELRQAIGIVLQDSVLFNGTIRENIKFGKPDATDEEMIAAAKIANIHDYIMSLDEGYDTKITNSNSVFSTGQKQLISIARTIITNPQILVLDEATSNVDTITEANIQKAMDAVIKGRTSFVIAHRLKTILNADKILVLKDGEIIESGSHKELLDQGGFYATLYYNQFVQ